MYPKSESLSLNKSKNLFPHPAGHGQSPDSEPDETVSVHGRAAFLSIFSMDSASCFGPFGERHFLRELYKFSCASPWPRLHGVVSVPLLLHRWKLSHVH